MSTVRQVLKFDTMGDIDAGSLRIAVNDALKLLTQDLHDRPNLEKARVMTLKVALEPVVDPQSKDSFLTEVSINWIVDPKVPSKGSAMTVLAAQRDGTLAFMSDLPDAGQDQTLLDEAERKQVEREERARERKEA